MLWLTEFIAFSAVSCGFRCRNPSAACARNREIVSCASASWALTSSCEVGTAFEKAAAAPASVVPPTAAVVAVAVESEYSLFESVAVVADRCGVTAAGEGEEYAGGSSSC